MLWPPPFKLRQHHFSRRIKLTISKKNGLVISAPLRFNKKHISSILEIHKQWIMDHLQKLDGTLRLPQQLMLRAKDECWRINYEISDIKLQLIERPNYEIFLLGKTPYSEQGKNLLLKWLRRYAAEFLKEELAELSAQTGLRYQRIIIRDQYTRWGSCNLKKTISLNYKLIFLPQVLVKYVLIHELCHTQYLNHSAGFWRLVEQFDPEYRINKSLLRKNLAFVPYWLS